MSRLLSAYFVNDSLSKMVNSFTSPAQIWTIISHLCCDRVKPYNFVLANNLAYKGPDLQTLKFAPHLYKSRWKLLDMHTCALPYMMGMMRRTCKRARCNPYRHSIALYITYVNIRQLHPQSNLLTLSNLGSIQFSSSLLLFHDIENALLPLSLCPINRIHAYVGVLC